MTTTKYHSRSSVASHHPVHGVAEFANAAARTGATYVPGAATAGGDLYKVVLQTDTLTWWLITAVSGGGVATFRQVFFDSSDQWSPLAPPAAPSAQDDEFTTGALDAKWGTWDPGTVISSKSCVDDHLVIESAGNGGVRWAGIYQAVPGTEYAFYTRLSVDCLANEIVEAALFVAQDIVGSPTTADFLNGEIYSAALPAIGWLSRRWDAYNGSASGATSSVGYPIAGVYLRGRVNGSTVSFDYSMDGVSWYVLNPSVAFGSNPAYYGIAIMTQTNAITGRIRADFFRSFAGAGKSGRTATSLGRRIAVGLL